MAIASKNTDRTSLRRGFDLVDRVRKAWGEGPIYQAQLKGPAPDRLLFHPEDPSTPDADIGRALIRGRIALGDEDIDCEGELERIWDLCAPDGALASYLHRFSWLHQLKACGEDGAKAAPILMRSWLDRHEKWSSSAWAPYATGERLIALCAHYHLVAGSGDLLWRSRVLSSMARQTRHLARTAHRAETGYDRLMTAISLSIAAYCLPGCDRAAERGVEMARRELRLQLRPDGGHLSRNPSRQLRLAFRLKLLVETIQARKLPAPGYLHHILARVSQIALFFRCADGRLAVFNGGYEDDPRLIIAVQSAASDSLAPEFVRHTGYHKVNAARAQLIVDANAGARSAGAFESAGSLQFSSGRSRVIVNCGNGAHLSDDWRRALSGAAAHSVVSFEEGVSPTWGEVSHRRAEETKGNLIEIERALSASDRPNAHYCRRLFLAANGADLRGEELFSGAREDLLAAAIWRFHLHPGVKASLARDRRSVILALPNKEGWRFKSNCAVLSLEKTVYCGDGGKPVSSEQIVMRARDAANAMENVRWALRRLDGV